MPNKSTFENPVAITKHPPGTATYLVRVCTKDGSYYQKHLHTPKPISEMVRLMEEEAQNIRKFFKDKD